MKDVWMRLTAKLPATLAALSMLAIAIGGIGLVGAVGLYTGYRPIEGDAGVEMNVPVTGVMVGLYFLMFIVFGGLIIKGKTFGHSGLVLTNVILALITVTVVKSGALWLAVPMGLLALVSLALCFHPDSMNWYKTKFQER
ncbi:hypothetical protein [Corynebacterium auriscanis]|uniref:hypothetical protein n=1 Tax=Corynebacterium auriscanis TaxID=99807 RepID=UPI003CEC0C49